MEWHAIKKEAALSSLSSSLDGLSEQEASLRLEKYGKNRIEEIYKISPIKIFFKQFKSYIIYVLLAASIIALLISHYLDASLILAVVFLNAVIGFIQQYRAEKSIIELKKLMEPRSKIIRNGKLSIINSSEIVPGDILILNEGDKITADARILNSENLEVNEAILTGESLPIEKFSDIIPENASLTERINMLYAGTNVVKGNCKALVVSTGMNTEFGKIASSLQQIHIPETPMQKKLDKFAGQISIFVLIISALIIILGIVKGLDLFEILLMAVVVAISAIPEALPAVITISLALASRKMLANKVIIRRLPAAETLGSVTVICSDKTGTITEERMQVTNIFAGNKFYDKQDDSLLLNEKKADISKNKSLYQLVKSSVMCNNARFEKQETHDGIIAEKYEIIGDPTESALVLSALNLGIDKKILAENEPRISEFSFTSARKMMSILRKSDNKNILYAKGASSSILAQCSSELIDGKIRKLTSKRKLELIKISEKMETQALRVLAFAFKEVHKNADENNLIFLGFIGMQDPPRPEVKQALEICRRAGIKVKMITGDSALTARAIASQIGIEGKMITGQELDEMSDEQLKLEIRDIAIFARTDPKQKLRIATVLMQLGEQVAITGDGVNDVLALKKADIGIAMGQRGTDVAREVSDMILVEDNFASIVNAVEEGRTVYDNIKKVTKYQLAVNFSEILMVFYTIILALPLPFLPVQILWMNLVTDSLPAVFLVNEKENVMTGKPRKEKSVLDNIKIFLILAGMLTFFAELGVFLITLDSYPIEKVRTLVVNANIFFELFFLLTCRSDRKLSEIGFFSNKPLLLAVLGAMILQILAIYTPLNILLRFTPLSLNDWLLILPFSLSGIVIFEAWKYIRRKPQTELR